MQVRNRIFPHLTLVGMVASSLLASAVMGQAISNITVINNAGDAVHGSVLAEDSLCFTDRTHEYNDIPDILAGAEYIQVANDDKNSADYELSFDLAREGRLFILLDDRVGDDNGDDPPTPGGGVMDWLIQQGFKDTGINIGIDEGGNGTIESISSVFSRAVIPGSYTLYAQNNGGSRNMYGVAFAMHPYALHPVFEFLISQGSSPLPILQGGDLPNYDGDTFDGTSTIDTYGGFVRYDSDRLLLGVRENGINETDAGHDAELAAQYPDRSLIWIDAATGEPQGIAVVVGIAPVPLDQDFLDAGGTVEDFYYNFGVSDDGVVYVGYKNKIVRYAPDGNGGFGAPTVAFTFQDDGSDYWHQWRWENVRVWGAGADTLIFAGGKTWRTNQGYHLLETEDGETFEWWGPYLGAAGGASKVVPGQNPEYPDDSWIFSSSYPGSSNGVDSRFGRAYYDGFGMGGDNTFAPEVIVGGDPSQYYDTHFISDVDAVEGSDVMVAYSTPSWNNAGLGYDPPRPGWLALHDFVNGTIQGTYKLNVTEAAEWVPGDSSVWHGTLGNVTMNIVDEGTEILWYSGIYGYGRYIVGENIIVESAELNIERTDDSVRLSWPASATGLTLQSATVADPAGDWTNVDTPPVEEDGMNVVTLPATAAESFFRLVR